MKLIVQILCYNQTPHDSLGDLTPVEYRSKNAGDSIFNLSA